MKANAERALFPPAVNVKFTSRDVREKLCRARKVLNDITSQDLGFSEENRIFINESLTHSNKELFKQARNQGGARGAFAPPPPTPTGPKGPHFDTQYPS